MVQVITVCCILLTVENMYLSKDDFLPLLFLSYNLHYKDETTKIAWKILISYQLVLTFTNKRPTGLDIIMNNVF